MAAVNLDELEHAALLVDDGEGRATALGGRAPGMFQQRNDANKDAEAPRPAAPPAGDATHLAGDQATIRDLVRAEDIDGFERLLDERGATESWQRFRTEETQTALRRWCDEHGLQVSG